MTKASFGYNKIQATLIVEQLGKVEINVIAKEVQTIKGSKVTQDYIDYTVKKKKLNDKYLASLLAKFNKQYQEYAQAKQRLEVQIKAKNSKVAY